MTLDKFLKLASEHSDDFWILGTGKIREKVTNLSEYYSGDCIISHICNKEKGTNHRTTGFCYAGAHLGLKNKTIKRIADASDHTAIDPKLRKRILKALDLKETND